MKINTTIRRSALARCVVVAGLRKLASAGLGTLAILLTLLGSPQSLTAQSSLPQSANGGLIVADFNHDGIPDTLVPATSGNTFTLSFGAVPYGTFSAVAKLVPFPTLCANVVTGSVAAGDFNGDGIPDLAMVCFGGQLPSTTLFIMLGNGDGTFTQGARFSSLSNIVLADFNHDGILDIVSEGANGSNQQQVMFYAGNGDGTFQTPVTSTLPNHIYSSPLAVDVNQDGYPDLVLGNFATSQAETVDVYGNNKDGTFGTTVPAAGTYAPSVSVTVGAYPSATDLTVLTGNYFNTGLPDLAVPDAGTNSGIFVIKNTSTSTSFSFATAVKTQYTGMQSAVTASFAGGLSDFLVFGGTNLTALVNDGAGNFRADRYIAFSILNSSSLYAAVDANGDGHADVYTATNTSTGSTLTVNLVSGTASASSQPLTLSAGTVAVSATWPGNINFSGSTANGSQTVNALATTVGLVSSKNPSHVGDTITFTATVISDPGNYIPTGTITFTDGATTLGTAQLLNGVVSGTVTTASLAAGMHTIQAAYSGDNIFAASLLTLTQEVDKVVPTITWSTPSAITYGTALSGTQLNATATDPVGGATIPGTLVYTPGAGAILNAGTQTLGVVFTPTDPNAFTSATGSVSLLVNAVAPTISWIPAVTTIPYGTALGAQELNATATGVGGVAIPGTFVYSPASGTVLNAGSQTLSVTFTPTSSNYLVAHSGALVTVTQAASTLAWTTPASIAYGTPLSATQLNATATGITGATLPGTFVYNPAAGTVLNPGSNTLSVTFTPTDAVNYAIATKTVTEVVSDLTLTSITPNTALIGAPATTITITGSGIVSGTVARVNGTNIATTYVSPTTLTAIIPASYFAANGTLQITLLNSATESITSAVPFTVSTPVPQPTLTAPSTAPPGTQPSVNFGLTTSYPVPLVATFTLNDKSNVATGVTDPAVQFSTGGTTYTVTIPAGSLTTPPISVQTGTLAATITVPVKLTVNGVDVTPGALAATIVVPAAVPIISAASLTRTGQQLTVTVIGFSNTLDVAKADFHFTPVAGGSLSTTDLSADVTSVFNAYFVSPAALTYGSTFMYTQVFNVSDNASNIGSVQVTLTNSQGKSVAQTAQ